VNRTEHEGILAIFLAEAEEIVQRLSEQLAELQYGYDGQRVLDDIHRGFHTLHGGASVLDLPELVECALLSERLMERLRTRRLSLSPGAVSLILSAVKAIEVMLARRINHQSPELVSSELKQRLIRATNGTDKSSNTVVSASSDPDAMGLFFDGRLTQRKFGSDVRVDSSAMIKSDNAAQITDDEFENILDNLYGKGRGPTPLIPQSGGETTSVGTDVETLTRLMPKSVVTAMPVEGDSIGHLVQELCWVRNRLMRFQGSDQKTELDKALAYLDLVTQDLESWLDEREKNR
jgi:two-component system chemotaxis sensor kinase CheA